MKEELEGIFDSVMVIDDNNIDLYIASRMITNNKFAKNVLQYASALEALKYLQEHMDNLLLLPEVIFVDIHMPWMSGFEFMLEYDKLPATLKNHCKVFMLSSSIDEQDLAKAGNDKNVVAMKEKPINKKFLIEFGVSHDRSLV